MDKSKFQDIILVDDSNGEVVIVETFENGDYIIVPYAIAESVITDPAKQTGKWAEYISKWQLEGRL